MFSKRRLNGNEEVNYTSKPSRSFRLCMQLTLTCASAVILGFGLAITGTGLWGYLSQKEYLSITDNNTELTRLSFSLLVTGIFVTVLGVLGLIGSVFSRTIAGQTLLGVFAFVLVLVIISEVGAGAAAIGLKVNIREVYLNSARISQLNYAENGTASTTQHWDEFQQKFHCCGADGYANGMTPYFKVFLNDSVPKSCCVNMEEVDCDGFAKNATAHKLYLYNRGCPSVVSEKLEGNLNVVAGIAIAMGCIQLLAVLLAVILAYMTSKMENEKKSYSYKMLQEEHQPAVS